jgi:hypothetical protein
VEPTATPKTAPTDNGNFDIFTSIPTAQPTLSVADVAGTGLDVGGSVADVAGTGIDIDIDIAISEHDSNSKSGLLETEEFVQELAEGLEADGVIQDANHLSKRQPPAGIGIFMEVAHEVHKGSSNHKRSRWFALGIAGIAACVVASILVGVRSLGGYRTATEGQPSALNEFSFGSNSFATSGQVLTVTPTAVSAL